MLSRIRGIFVVIQFSITVFFVVAFMYMFRKHTHKIIKFWMKIQMKFLGIKLEEIGKMDDSCDLILMNHQSLIDIIIVEYIHNRDIAWVGKKEISELFFFGHIMKAPRMISIDRENKAGLMSLIKQVRDRLDKGRPIAMFPEGTRSDGTIIRKFKSGSALIANKFNLKVQPLIIINSNKIMDSKKLLAKPGIVKIIYLTPVQASKSSDWFKEVEKEMNEVFEKEMKNDI